MPDARLPTSPHHRTSTGEPEHMNNQDMSNYHIVDPNKAEDVKKLPPSRGSGSPMSAVTSLLLDGQTLFTENKKVRPAAATITKHGRKLHQRSADGGTYYWAAS